MQQGAYNKMKASGIGVGVVTFLSIATMSSTKSYNTITSSINRPFVYEGIHCFYDGDGGICTSAQLTDMSRGVVITEEVGEDDFVAVHKRFDVQINIVRIKEHVSHFDFEEEFEEI